MKFIWQSLFIFNVLLSSLAIYHYFSKKSIDVSISYHEEFSFDKILVQFHENEKMVLDVRKIKYFFMFPNNFYCENVKVNEESLPLFFIESTKKNFFSLMLFLLKTNEDDIKKLPDGGFNSLPRHNDILNMKKKLQESFPYANSIEDIEKEISQSITLPDNKNLIHNLEKDDPTSLSNVSSNRAPIESSNENIGTLDIKDHLRNWKLKMCYIIPVVYLRHIGENLSDNVEFIGRGMYGSCYKIAIQINKLRYENFVLKKLIIESLREIAIFSYIPIEEQHGFCRPQSLVIDSDGKCAGYLMKYAEFGNFADFAENLQVKDDRYFYNQLFNVAKAINTLHQNGISHNDVHLYNIFVCKKGDAEERNNYYFQLGDFGRSFIISFYNYDNDSVDNIPNKQAETKICNLIASSSSDLTNFIKHLDKYLPSLLLNIVNMSRQVLLTDCSMFDLLEKYFKDVDNSFANTNSIKSSKSDV